MKAQCLARLGIYIKYLSHLVVCIVHTFQAFDNTFLNCMCCGCSCSTVFYGQYRCTGAGADETGRVGWSHELTTQEAEPFMSHDFIDGDDWL